MPRIVLAPSRLVVLAADGDSIFEALRRAGVAVPTACVGRASCGLCRVKVLRGEEFLTPINADEQRHLGTSYFVSKLRLSCQARVAGGDVEVQIPDAGRR